jgi:phosphatidylinositol alpha 1,6-mannosyltransferase
MRIAYFAGSMRPGHDGVTRVLYRMTDALRSEQIPHMFVSPILPPDEERTVPMLKVPSCAFPLYPDYRVASPCAGWFGRQVRAFRPDLLHIHSPCSLGLAAMQYGRRHHIPVVATYHTHFASYAGYYNIRFLEPFGWSYLRHLYDRCQAVFVPSLPIIDELRSHGFHRLHHLPHGVDTEAFSPVFRSQEWRSGHGIGEDRHMLLYAGRLVWEKDLRTLAEAYRRISALRSDITLVLAGVGPVRQELEAMMPGALFLGQLDGQELARAFASADLFVFPSTTETFGNVILEAMASGTVPVCARKGGAAGVVGHGITGLLANPGDPVDLCQQVSMLLDAPARREAMALRALQHAREQSWQHIIRRMIGLYADVLADYGKQRRRTRAA